MNDDASKRFSDEQARAILARAIEIDSRSPLTTADELRAIAAEIGVSPASLEAAMREQTTSIVTRRRLVAQRIGTGLAVSGVPLGLAAGWLLNAEVLAAAPVMTGLGLMSLGLVASAVVIVKGSTGTLRSFHAKNVLLWGGIAAGSLTSVMLAGGGNLRLAAIAAVAWSVRGWLASSVMGSAAVIAVRRTRRPDHSDPTATPPAAPGETSRWVHAARRVLRWVSRPFDRKVERVRLTKPHLGTAHLG
jgi:hypothetical protein